MAETKPQAVAVNEGSGVITFENASASQMTPAASRFMTTKDVMADMRISQTSACKIIKEINDGLKAKGKITFRGRVLRSAYLKATCED
ncbi:hypothetical protein [uncultured Selenomonas sp.]|uniref:hypothetical protein n=1 Tax=uncultured Selenomonas sp. TaxID=159275 RepID=UPI0025E6BD0A|nr:hypothetical protein [uncultured Selenomonas sp.]